MISIENVYIIPIVFIFHFSCTHREEYLQLENINISLQEMPQVGMDSMIEDVSLIPLETDNNCLINHIDKVKIFDDKVFVLDRKAGNILIFNTSGKFLFEISKKGRGFGEYITIADFDINPKSKEIYILDGMTDKLLVFEDNKFVKDYKLKIGAKVIAFCFLGDEIIVFDNQLSIAKEEWKYHLIFTDNNFNIIDKSISYNKSTSLTMSPVSSFSLFDKNTISYQPVYNNIIYHIENAKAKPKYKLDFGENWLDEDFLISGKLNAMNFFQDLRKLNSIYFLNTIESNSHLFVYFTFKERKYAYLYDKETHKGAFVKNYMKDGCGYNGLPIIPDGDFFVGVVNPSELSNENGKVLQKHLGLSTIGINNNPILSFIKFKNIN